MAMTAEDYRDQLLALQPPGAALPVDPDSTWGRLLQALADELARIDGRADDLVDEADPRTTYELLPDWERVAGLPDACTPDGHTVDARRDALTGRIAGIGGQSAAYFIWLAADLGYSVTITEFRTADAGAAVAGDAINGEPWRFAWQVNAPQTTVTDAVAGSSGAGEPLRAWGNELLECVLRARRPAHTTVLFSYGG